MHRIWPIWPQFAPLQSPVPRPRNCKTLCCVTCRSPPTAGCVESRQEDEYRLLVDGSVLRCGENYLHLSMTKMKETVVHFGRSRSSPSPATINGAGVEIVQNYRTEVDLSCLYFHMRSFVKRTIFYTVVCCAQPSNWRTPAVRINSSGKLGLWRRWWSRGELDGINHLCG